MPGYLGDLSQVGQLPASSPPGFCRAGVQQVSDRLMIFLGGLAFGLDLLALQQHNPFHFAILWREKRTPGRYCTTNAAHCQAVIGSEEKGMLPMVKPK